MSSEWQRALNLASGLVRRAIDQVRDSVESAAESQERSIWKRAANELDDHFEQLAKSLQPEFNLGWGLGGSSSEDPDRPLHRYASFMASRPARVHRTVEEAFSAPSDPEVTISVDFGSADTSLRYDCALRLDNHVVHEGPAGTIDIPRGVIGSYGKIRAALAEITQFIDHSRPLVTEQLRIARGRAR